jgi:aromatic-L-amino-acid decarboxylase
LFALVPEYLITHEQSYAVNLMDYGVQLGRRFRALKLWFVMRAFGLQGLRQRLQYHIDIAGEFAGWVRATAGWTLMAAAPFSLVCFRYAPPELSDADADKLNERILTAVNAEGSVYLSHTRLKDRYTIRLAIGNLRTELQHVAKAWKELQRAAQAAAPIPLRARRS